MNDGRIFAAGGGARRLLRGAAIAACALLAAAVVAGCARHHHRSAKTPEEFRERFEKVTERALKKADATEDQRARIRPIADDLATALYGLREEHRAIQRRFVSAFEAEKVDPEEVARIRADALALADRASRTVTDALVKASAVLSPEQRRKLAERWKQCM